MATKIQTSRVKMLALVLLIILITACTVLTDFITAEFSTSIFSDAYYWVQTISMQSAVIILLFVARSMAKEKERGVNELFQMLTTSLKDAYVSLNRDNLNGAFKEYIAADNRKRKLKAYLNYLSAKKVRCDDLAAKLDFKIKQKEIKAADRGKAPGGFVYSALCSLKKGREDKSRFWQRKIDRAAEEVDYMRRVKYIRWSYGVIFSDAEEDVQEEDDPRKHERRDVAFILLTKGLSILAFGLIATSYISPHFAFDIALIYKTIIKVLQIVLGLYTGAVSGQDFIRHTMCSKLTIRFNYVKQFKELRKG